MTPDIRTTPATDGPLADALLVDGALPPSGRDIARPALRLPRGRPLRRRVLPRPLVARQGGPLHPRRELHGVVLVEGLRQGRDHHVGDAADRLPVGRPRLPRVRAARLPARRRVQLVHLLAHARALPLHPRHARRALPRGEAAPRRPGRGLGVDRRRPRGIRARTRARAARAVSSARPGTRRSRSSRPPTCTRSRPTAPTGSRASRRSPRCRWCRTAPARGS